MNQTNRNKRNRVYEILDEWASDDSMDSLSETHTFDISTMNQTNRNKRNRIYDILDEWASDDSMDPSSGTHTFECPTTSDEREENEHHEDPQPEPRCVPLIRQFDTSQGLHIVSVKSLNYGRERFIETPSDEQAAVVSGSMEGNSSVEGEQDRVVVNDNTAENVTLLGSCSPESTEMTNYEDVGFTDPTFLDDVGQTDSMGETIILENIGAEEVIGFVSNPADNAIDESTAENISALLECEKSTCDKCISKMNQTNRKKRKLTYNILDEEMNWIEHIEWASVDSMDSLSETHTFECLTTSDESEEDEYYEDPLPEPSCVPFIRLFDTSQGLRIVSVKSLNYGSIIDVLSDEQAAVVAGSMEGNSSGDGEQDLIY